MTARILFTAKLRVKNNFFGRMMERQQQAFSFYFEWQICGENGIIFQLQQ
jgi:hypothetical protein